jgi:serine/threonine protein kinase
VTGQTPFEASTALAILNKHLTEQLTNPQDLNEEIPDGVAQVIIKMMAKEPADRYAGCAELIADLEEVAQGRMPSSQVLDVGKSSIAVARAPRRAAVATRRPAGPVVRRAEMSAVIER